MIQPQLVTGLVGDNRHGIDIASTVRVGGPGVVDAIEQDVPVNAAIALARLGSMEALGTILEALQLGEMQARREAAYGLGFFSGERQKARAAAQAIIDNPASAWKAEAGISLLRLELAASGEKLELLSNASTRRQPRVQAWSIQEIARLGGKDAAA
mgnify:CR=1 FL=1